MFRSLIDRAARTSRRTRTIVVVTVASLSIVTWAAVTGHIIAVAVIAVVGAVITAVTMRVVKVGRVRKAKIARAVGRTAWPKRFGPWMLPDETVEWEGRMHPMVIFPWWALCFGGPVLAILTAPLATSWAVFLVLFFVPPLIASWKILEWWFDWRVITNVRVVEIAGILTTSAPAAQLGQILTARPIKPFFSRLIEFIGVPHYAHIVFETAAQVEAIPEFRFVSDPEQVNALLQSHFRNR